MIYQLIMSSWPIRTLVQVQEDFIKEKEKASMKLPLYINDKQCINKRRSVSRVVARNQPSNPIPGIRGCTIVAMKLLWLNEESQLSCRQRKGQ